MEQNYHMKLMTADHLDQIAALERACFSAPWSREMLAEELDNLRASYIVAERDGGVLGYAGLHAVLDEGYITNVAVSPEHRREGVGRALLEVFLRFGRESGLRFLTLEVRAGNEAAIGLYESCGFREAGRRKNYYDAPREDAVLMTLWFGEGAE